jgi:hypothetical protein
MKHIVHLIWFDLKATRNLILVWGLVLVVQAVLLAVGPDRVVADTLGNSVGWDFGMLAVRVGVTIAIAVALVQYDPLVGTTAFWRTRPASRIALMTSKLLTMLIVLAVLPALVVGLLLLYLGLMPFDALAGATTVAVEQIGTVGLTLPLAMITASLAHFAIAAAGTFAYTWLLARICLPALFYWWPGLAVNLGGWAMPLAVGALPLGVILVVLNQYLTLRTKRSVAIIVVAVLLAMYAIRLPHAERAVAVGTPVDPAILNAASVTIHVDPASIQSEIVTVGGPAAPRQATRMSAQWTWTGEPNAVILLPASIDSTIRFGDRSEFRMTGSRRSSRLRLTGTATADTQPYRSIRAALGGDALVLPISEAGLGYSSDIAELPTDMFRSHYDDTGVLDANLRMRVLRYVVLASVPLKTGASFTVPARRGTVIEVERSSVGASVTLRDVSAESYPPSYSTPFYLLRNAVRHQAALVTGQVWRRYGATFDVAGRRVRVGSVRLDVVLPPGEAERIGLNDEWLKEAELVWVDLEELGSVTLPLHVDEFRLRPPPPTAK